MRDREHGPFANEREASQTEAVRAVYAAFDADPGPGRMRPHNVAMLTAACEEAGVELGAYDLRKVEWLGTWEPQTCVVIAGLIHRAHEAGRASAMQGSVTQWGLRYESEDAPEPIVMPYSEEAARSLHRETDSSPGVRRTVVTRHAGPWKEAD